MKEVELQKEDQELVDAFRALGHPARLKILRVLGQRGACICSDVVDELPLAQSTVSQHLKVLKEAGFIVGEVEGASVCYCIAPSAVERLTKSVSQLAADIKQNKDCCEDEACCDDKVGCADKDCCVKA